MKRYLIIGFFMAIAFVGGFWLTRYIIGNFGDANLDKSQKVWKERIQLLKTGDIIFQTSNSSQSFAIQEATKSPYSHMGLIESIDGELFVLEAVQPVKRSPLKEWVDGGVESKYAVKRLRDFSYLSTEKGRDHWDQICESYLGKNYDSQFNWSDEEMYCSELVWKVYNQVAGVRIGEPKELQYFDIQSKAVKDKLVERYGDSPPIHQLIISSQAIFESPLLVEIESNY